MAGKVRQLAKHGRAASKSIAMHVPHMRCRHRDRSRDDHRHEKMMEKSKMVEPASDLLVLLRIRRQLLAAALVAFVANSARSASGASAARGTTRTACTGTRTGR